MAGGDTRARLLDGALEAVRRHGIAGVSARTVAGVAGVNQALIFYHFGTVADLLVEACRRATEARVAGYRGRFADVRDLRELLAVGRELHAEERSQGNVDVLAQMLAGAQADPRLAEATAAALGVWTGELELVLRRLLAGSPVAPLVDAGGLARAVAAAFVGMELFEGVDADGAERALAAVDRLGLLLEVVDDLGPVAAAALRRKLDRAAARAPSTAGTVPR